MTKEFIDRIKVFFPTLKEANEALAFMRAKLKESIGHWVSVYDLIGCCSMTPDFAYRFTSEELNDWGWTSIDGLSLEKGPHRGTCILTMPPTRKRGMIHLNVVRGDGKSTLHLLQSFEKLKELERIEQLVNDRGAIRRNIIRYNDEDLFRRQIRFTYEYVDNVFNPPMRIKLDRVIECDMLVNAPKFVEQLEEKWINELIDKVIKVYKTIMEENNMPFENQFKLNWNDCIVGYDLAKPSAPKIKKIEVYNDRVVKVTFDDGSFTKSVCQENDIFDLDVGITVCLMKKMLDTGKGDGTRIYNDIIRDAHKLINDKENEKIEQQLEKEKLKKKAHKAMMKRQAKKLKAKEEAIDIQKLAFIRAMQETGMVNDGK